MENKSEKPVQSLFDGINGKHVLRSSSEEVEVIAYFQVENGERNEGDWVTYIDSEGKEHIKEHLNIQLDFKAGDGIAKTMMDLLVGPKMPKMPKYPSVRNTRIFEVAKRLVVEGGDIGVAVKTAERLVDAVGNDAEEEEEEEGGKENAGE